MLKVVRNLGDAVDYNALIRAIERQDIQAAVEALNIRPQAFRPLDAEIAAAFEAGGIATAASLPVITTRSGNKIKFSFNVRNLMAEERLATQSGKRITAMTAEAIKVARDTLAEGMALGRNPTQTARILLGTKQAGGGYKGGVLGLADNQAQWVRNAVRELGAGGAVNLNNYLSRNARDKRYDATVIKYLESGEALPDELIGKITRRYSDGLLKYRADTVGRTETMEALNASKFSAHEQFVQEAGASGALTEKVWIATRDNRTREQHRDMNGVSVVGLNTPFTMPDGSLMMYPCDSSLGAGPGQVINCRCTSAIRLRYEAD